MRTVAVVQARLGSTRLPAKILLDLAGRTALERCLRRVARFEGIDDLVVATTDRPEDEVVSGIAARLGFSVVRGDAQDVLSRYLLAARETRADYIVRCTSDCPLLDPEISGRVIRAFQESQHSARPLDYASTDERLPRGLDTEIVRVSSLENLAESQPSADFREHVTLGIYRKPERYACSTVMGGHPVDLSEHRWTLDTIEDYHFLWMLHRELGQDVETADLRSVLRALNGRPELLEINRHVRQKPA